MAVSTVQGFVAPLYCIVHDLSARRSFSQHKFIHARADLAYVCGNSPLHISVVFTGQMGQLCVPESRAEFTTWSSCYQQILSIRIEYASGSGPSLPSIPCVN